MCGTANYTWSLIDESWWICVCYIRLLKKPAVAAHTPRANASWLSSLFPPSLSAREVAGSLGFGDLALDHMPRKSRWDDPYLNWLVVEPYPNLKNMRTRQLGWHSQYFWKNIIKTVNTHHHEHLNLMWDVLGIGYPGLSPRSHGKSAHNWLVHFTMKQPLFKSTGFGQLSAGNSEPKFDWQRHLEFCLSHTFFVVLNDVFAYCKHL